MEIRKGRPEDAAAIASLESPLLDPDIVELWQWRLAGAEGALPIVLAETDSAVVGLAWVEVHPEEATTGRLRGLYVDPAQRRQGYGRRLLVSVQRLLAQASIDGITMEPTDDDGLTALAAVFGWQRHGNGWYGDLDESAHVETNRWSWDDWSDSYVEAGRRAYSPEHRANPNWGCFGIPEADVGLLNDLEGKDVVELGCGTGYVSVWCLDAGARTVIGLDNSPDQLATARLLQVDAGLSLPLVFGDAEQSPFAPESFDVAISEYGAAIWCDPERWIPEAARLLRPGGKLMFLGTSVALTLCVRDFEADGAAGPTMVRPQKGMYRSTYPDSTGTEFHISHGEMIRLLGRSGFEVLDLIELYVPEGVTSRFDFVDAAWGSQWPIEEVWVARRSNSCPGAR